MLVFIALSLNRDVCAGRSNTRLPFWLEKLLWFILGYLVPPLVLFFFLKFAVILKLVTDKELYSCAIYTHPYSTLQ
jgi:hypothetical protein